jgi:hypothetical protein
MKHFLREFFKTLFGHYSSSNGVIDCQSCRIIEYLKQINYKGDFYESIARNSGAQTPDINSL